MNWKEIKRNEYGTITPETKADMYRSLPILYYRKDGQKRVSLIYWPEDLGRRIADSNRWAANGWGHDMTHYCKVYYPRKSDRLTLPGETVGRLGEVTHHPVEAETR